MNKSLKILFLPKWYPNRFDALDGIFVVDHAKAAARKNDVFLLFVHSDAALSGSKTITYNKSGGFAEMIVYFRSIKTGILFIDRLFTAIRYFSVQFRSYYQIKKIWGRPDITHVHVLLRSSILACWLKKIENIPYIITEHWTGYDPKSGKKINPFKKKLLKYIIKKSEAVTTVSGCLQENMKRICKEANYLHISNAIDETIFCIQPKKPAAIKKLIHVSTLSDHQKNFGKILQAIAEVSQQRKDFELHIIGKGIERKKQMERAQKLNILDRFVFFHGYLPKQEVAQMIATSDLMIMFSKFENQPCVILESLLCGVPVLASDIEGTNEMINEKNGIRVVPNDMQMLQNTILSFLSEKPTFNAAEIRKNALIYGYETVAEKLSALYSSVKKQQAKKISRQSPAPPPRQAIPDMHTAASSAEVQSPPPV